ncbi:MAG: anthranilate synthase component I [Acidobacteriales bacterium]|nr:anthranilate synthase component I [Terriglobales bacterium]
MLTLDLDRFIELAGTHRSIPIARVLASDLLTPVAAFLRIAHNEPYAFLLESVEGGEHVGRYTFLGIRPYMRVEARGKGVVISRGDVPEHRTGDILTIARELIEEARIAPELLTGLPPFSGGLVGFLSYDVVRQWEPVGDSAQDETNLPDAALLFFDRILAFDHATQQAFLIATVHLQAELLRAELETAYRSAVVELEHLEAQLSAPLPVEAPREKQAPLTPPQPRTSRTDFLRSVERAKEYIRAGDAFQIVLSLRLSLDLPPNLRTFEIYRALRRVNPSPYMYYLRMDGLEILGSSPEMLVKVRGRDLEYRPIAGTRPRGKDVAQDLALEQELLADEKERAEHVMLVDLGRNDLGRVSRYGSVEVSRFMFIERYSHVMHLVSSLRSQLRQELSALDALRACFPAGTLSGAPKVRAMQIIEELEPVRRGVYGGTVLYADFAGNLDSCIAIRTIVVKDGRAHIQAGAGIVADSDPEKEYEECMNKAAAALKSVQIASSS